MLAEESQHLLTYMAFVSSVSNIWKPLTPTSTDAGIVRVRQDLMDVAKAIGTFEPVSMLVQTVDLPIAQAMLSLASPANPQIHTNYQNRSSGIGGVTFIPLDSGFDDFWTRDTGCLFVKDIKNSNRLAGVGFNFNGWGNANTTANSAVPASVIAQSNKSKAAKFYQPFENDQKVAQWMANTNNAIFLKSTLTLEGGAIEHDGSGTAVITESSVLHVNRNPQLFDIPGGMIANAKLLPTAKQTVLAELNRTLGITKIIWIPGTAIYPAGCGAGAPSGVSTPDGETDITNGHADFYARFLAPGVVAVATDTQNATGEKAITEANIAILNGQTDAQGRVLKLVKIDAPSQYGTSAGLTLNNSQLSNFAAGYINFYTCNNALILPMFNDAVADANAVTALTPYLNGRKLVQVDILGISSGGGGLHCATQQLPS